MAIIKGKVIDNQTKAPLFGAAVFFKGTGYGAATDIDGNFQFTAPDNAYELNVKFIGYLPFEASVNVTSDVSYTISLNPDVNQLKEVTVTAQGIKPKTKIDFTKWIVPGSIAIGLLLLLLMLERKK